MRATTALASAGLAFGCRSHDRHLLNRLTYGPTPSLLAELEASGPAVFIERQLHPESINDSATEALLRGYRTITSSSLEIDLMGETGTAWRELHHATLLRAVKSRRQLFEVMVDFWTNHFNILHDSSKFQMSFDRDVIRLHALGRFSDLLIATALHPAMLAYLDGSRNSGDNPNENYARELLELHTVGVDGGYDEEDVRNAALVLSGWRVPAPTLEVRFHPSKHYFGPANVMDWSTQGTQGLRDGIDLLEHLALHPSTARHLAWKLCRRFVSDDPPESLVRSTADIYLSTRGEIVPVLRHIFLNQEFWGSMGSKLRRPYETLAAMLRAVDASIDPRAKGPAAANLRRSLEDMGQRLFGWPDPDGYPETRGYWLSSDGLLQRWRFAAELVINGIDGVEIDLSLHPLPSTAGGAVDAFARRILLRPLTPTERSTLLSYLRLSPEDSLTGIRPFILTSVVALLLSHPTFQAR